MKHILFLSFFACSIFQCVAQSNPRGLELNAIAPDFTAKDQDGKPLPMTETARDAKSKLEKLDPDRAKQIVEQEPESPFGS